MTRQDYCVVCTAWVSDNPRMIDCAYVLESVDDPKTVGSQIYGEYPELHPGRSLGFPGECVFNVRGVVLTVDKRRYVVTNRIHGFFFCENWYGTHVVVARKQVLPPSFKDLFCPWLSRWRLSRPAQQQPRGPQLCCRSHWLVLPRWSCLAYR